VERTRSTRCTVRAEWPDRFRALPGGGIAALVALERLKGELGTRTDSPGSFPSQGTLLRFVTALLIEIDGDGRWRRRPGATGRRDVSRPELTADALNSLA
jgi:hypothetical protein